MKILIVTVADEQEDLVKRLLEALPGTTWAEPTQTTDPPPGSLEALRKAIAQIPERGLFPEITDPVEWQRQIRSEWQ